MKRSYGTILFATALLAAPVAHAEVYLLGRGAGYGTAAGKFASSDIDPVHVEKVRCGNRTLDLEIYSLSEPFSALLARLKADSNARVSHNGRSLRYRKRFPGGVTEHLLVTDSGKNLVAFRILTPSNFAAGKDWHPELPSLPGGAVSELVIELPGRNAVFGMFNNAFGNPQGNMRAVSSNLSSEWSAMSDESLMPNGRGGVFTGKGNRILLVGFSDDGTGFFYLKK